MSKLLFIGLSLFVISAGAIGFAQIVDQTPTGQTAYEMQLYQDDPNNPAFKH